MNEWVNCPGSKIAAGKEYEVKFFREIVHRVKRSGRTKQPRLKMKKQEVKLVKLANKESRNQLGLCTMRRMASFV